MEAISAWWWLAVGSAAVAAVAAPVIARLAGRRPQRRKVITLREVDPNDVYTA